MLPAALLILASAHPITTGCGDSCRTLHHENPKVERLLAMAWQDKEAAEVLDVRHQEDLARDRELGAKYAAEVEKELKVSDDPELTGRLNRIAAELIPIANRTQVEALWGDKRLNPFDYQFKVVKGKDVNAFSLPGGFIYFYEGLLNYAQSDDEIAGVVAHEISHASLRHVATLQREQSKLQTIQLPLILIAILAGGGQGAATTLTATSLVSQAVGSGWSVKAEEAADYAGYQYLRKSRYNPTGMLTFMERLAYDERNSPQIDWGIYRTHPPSRERAESIVEFMQRDGIPVRRSQVASSFRTTVRPSGDGSVELRFGERRIVVLSGNDALKRADDLATRLNGFFDQTPEIFEVQLGEEDGQILGRRRLLLELTPADAAAAGSDLGVYRTQTLRNLRAVLFSIGFRVWDLR